MIIILILLVLQTGSYQVSQESHFITYQSPTYFLSLLTFSSALTAEREEEVQRVCAGKEFRLPVYSTSRTVIFTPNREGPKRVLLEKTMVNESVPVLMLVFIGFVPRLSKPVYNYR